MIRLPEPLQSAFPGLAFEESGMKSPRINQWPVDLTAFHCSVMLAFWVKNSTVHPTIWSIALLYST